VPGATITVDPLTEVPVTIAVTHVYDAVTVTDEDLSLSIEDYGRQVLGPQIAAVATRAELELGALLNARAADLSFPADPVDLADEGYRREMEDAILAAGEMLDENDVPAGGRFAAVSPSVARRLSRIDKFTQVDTTGRRDALAEASLGRLHGFTFTKSNALTAGSAHFYHQSGLAMGWLAPVIGAGVAGAVATSQGISLTALRQYRAETLSENAVVHTYVGSAEVDSDRIVSFDTTV
jgi:hypothetical protein